MQIGLKNGTYCIKIHFTKIVEMFIKGVIVDKGQKSVHIAVDKGRKSVHIA